MDKLTDLEQTVKTYLKENYRGKFNAVTSTSIAKQTGLTPRHIRKVVHDMRVKGVPVCSSQRGYYYAANELEVQGCLVWLKTMRKELDSAIGGLEKFRG